MDPKRERFGLIEACSAKVSAPAPPVDPKRERFGLIEAPR